MNISNGKFMKIEKISTALMSAGTALGVAGAVCHNSGEKTGGLVMLGFGAVILASATIIKACSR